MIVLSDVSRKWCTILSSVADSTLPISRPFDGLSARNGGPVTVIPFSASRVANVLAAAIDGSG